MIKPNTIHKWVKSDVAIYKNCQPPVLLRFWFVEPFSLPQHIPSFPFSSRTFAINIISTLTYIFDACFFSSQYFDLFAIELSYNLNVFCFSVGSTNFLCCFVFSFIGNFCEITEMLKQFEVHINFISNLLMLADPSHCNDASAFFHKFKICIRFSDVFDRHTKVYLVRILKIKISFMVRFIYDTQKF